jgi:hypothetical protein
MGQRHVARVAQEHRDAQLLFETLDLHRDRRGRPVDPRGRGGETAGLGNGNKAAQDIRIQHQQRVVEGRIHIIQFH